MTQTARANSGVGWNAVSVCETFSGTESSVERKQRWSGNGAFFGCALLLRIQPKRFELPTPFRRSIAQPRDVDASRLAAFQTGPTADPRWRAFIVPLKPHLSLRCVME